MINQIISYGVQEPSTVYDSEATSNCGREGNYFILSNIPSKKVFRMPNGAMVRAIVKVKMHHNLREPAISVDKVPRLNHNTLLIARKFTDAKYTTILNEYEGNIYDGKTTKITISEKVSIEREKI